MDILQTSLTAPSMLYLNVLLSLAGSHKYYASQLTRHVQFQLRFVKPTNQNHQVASSLLWKTIVVICHILAPWVGERNLSSLHEAVELIAMTRELGWLCPLDHHFLTPHLNTTPPHHVSLQQQLRYVHGYGSIDALMLNRWHCMKQRRVGVVVTRRLRIESVKIITEKSSTTTLSSSWPLRHLVLLQ